MSRSFTIAELRKNIFEIEEIFFIAMLAGYVSNKAPLTSPTLPSAKQILYYDRPWQVIDTWEQTEWTNQTGGVIRIYFEGTLVWMMQYFGAYAPEVIQFLQHALFQNYQEKKFLGGRGPERFSFENFEYRNEVAEGSSFRNFHGTETIWRNRALMGEHRYHGGLMI